MSTQTNTETTPAVKRKRVNLTLTPETHGRIKVWCARKGLTMQWAISDILDKAFAHVDTGPTEGPMP
jgi:hypothetical protein